MINEDHTQNNHILDANSINTFAAINNPQGPALNNENINNGANNSNVPLNNVYQDMSASLYPQLMPYNSMLVISNPAPNFLNFDPTYNHGLKNDQMEYINQYENKNINDKNNANHNYFQKLENIASHSSNSLVNLQNKTNNQGEYENIRSSHPQPAPIQQQIIMSVSAASASNIVPNNSKITKPRTKKQPSAKKPAELYKNKVSTGTKKTIVSNAIGPTLLNNVGNQNIHDSIPNKAKRSVVSRENVAKRSSSQTDNDWKLLHDNLNLFSLSELADVIRESESKDFKKNSLDNNLKKSTGSTKLSRDEFMQLLPLIPKSKRQQLFGGLFLKQACKISKDEHIPRSRIYAKYVNSCAHHNVPSLSPPLFGKLIKIIFPFITIHRYGVRGQTKYHYCGITLVDSLTDKQSINGSNGLLSNISTPNSPASGPHTPFGIVVGNHDFISNSEVSSPLRSIYDIESPSSSMMSPVIYSNNFGNTNQNNVNEFYSKDVDFIIKNLNRSSFASIRFQNKFFDFPNIEPYIPVHLRHSDSVSTLVSLYKYHCFSIFEAFKLMKVNSLTGIIGSFQKSLTSPVAKLYNMPYMLPWILKCDLKLYQSILSMVCESIFVFGNECFVNLSKHNVESIFEISKRFPKLVSESVNNLPKRLGVLKMLLAKQFSQLLAKMVEIDKLSSDMISSKISLSNFNYVGIVDIQDVLNNNNILQEQYNNTLIINSNSSTLYDHEEIIHDISKNNSARVQMICNAFENNVASMLKLPINSYFINQWLTYFIKLGNEMVQKEISVFPEMYKMLVTLVLDHITTELAFSKNEISSDDFRNFSKLKGFTVAWISWYGELSNFCKIFNSETDSNNLVIASSNPNHNEDHQADVAASTMSGSTVISGSSTPIPTNASDVDRKKQQLEDDSKVMLNYPQRKATMPNSLVYTAGKFANSDKSLNVQTVEHINNDSSLNNINLSDDKIHTSKIIDQNNNSNSTLISDISTTASMFLSIENLDSSISTNIKSHSIDLVSNANEKEIMNFFG